MKPGSFTSFLTLWQGEEYLSAKKRGQKPKKERRMCKLIKLLIVSGNHLWHCISPSRGAIRATCYDLSQFHGWWRLFHCWRAHSYSTTYCIIRADRSLVIFFSSFFFSIGVSLGQRSSPFWHQAGSDYVWQITAYWFVNWSRYTAQLPCLGMLGSNQIKYCSRTHSTLGV